MIFFFFFVSVDNNLMLSAFFFSDSWRKRKEKKLTFFFCCFNKKINLLISVYWSQLFFFIWIEAKKKMKERKWSEVFSFFFSCFKSRKMILFCSFHCYLLVSEPFFFFPFAFFVHFCLHISPIQPKFFLIFFLFFFFFYRELKKNKEKGREK